MVEAVSAHCSKGLVRGTVFPHKECPHRGALLLPDGSFVLCSLLGQQTINAAADGAEKVWKAFAVRYRDLLVLKLTDVCKNPIAEEVGFFCIRGLICGFNNGIVLLRIKSKIAQRNFYTLVHGYLPMSRIGQEWAIKATVKHGSLKMIDCIQSTKASSK